MSRALLRHAVWFALFAFLLLHQTLAVAQGTAPADRVVLPSFGLEVKPPAGWVRQPDDASHALAR